MAEGPPSIWRYTACIAGPGDLMVWELSATMESDGTRLDVIGRGSDLEAAAASAIAVLSQNGSVLEPNDDDSVLVDPGVSV